jgi:hypothetical protein
LRSSELATIPTVASSEQDLTSPFVAYHRGQRLTAFGRVLAFGIPLAATIVGLCLLGSLAPARADTTTSIALAPIDSGSAGLPTSQPTPMIEVSNTAATSVFHILVTATGYQQQIDECQWVRMDLDAEAPIVGAHTSCGGSVVLAMRPGDAVELSGQGLDGKYVVADSRDAHAGDVASTATAGMEAQVILQTCYPGTGGHERLVGLELQN